MRYVANIDQNEIRERLMTALREVSSQFQMEIANLDLRFNYGAANVGRIFVYAELLIGRDKTNDK